MDTNEKQSSNSDPSRENLSENPDSTVSSLRLSCRWMEDVICGEQFQSPEELDNHVANHHVKSDEEGMAKCFWEGCAQHALGRRFDGEFLQVHIRRHTSNKPFKCEMCTEVFSYEYNLECHKKDAHGKEYSGLFKIDDADFLKKHHNMASRGMSPGSQRRNRAISRALLSQLVEETQEDAHVCFWKTNGQMCMNKYDEKKELLAHIKESHLNSWSNQCCWRECAETEPFSNYHSLVAHVRIHLREFFKCSHCSKVFECNKKQRKHERTCTMAAEQLEEDHKMGEEQSVSDRDGEIPSQETNGNRDHSGGSKDD